MLGLVVVALCVAALAYVWSRGGFTSAADRIAAREAAWENAHQALAAGQADVAERLASEIVVATPDYAPARLLLGEFALARNQPAEAREHFDAVPATAGSDYEVALLRGGIASQEDNRLRAAESHFQTLLARSPEQLDAHRELARLYTVTGRRWQSRPHLEAIVRAGAFDLEQLLMLGDPDSVIDFSKDLERAQRRDPADPLPLVGLARIARKNGDHKQALTLVRSALKANPDDLQAQATLGQLLLENAPAEVAQWHAALPSAAEQHPEIWS
jgi:predicted Zn-dependent protease